MIILKLEQMFLNYVIQRITKSFTFKYFQKTEVYLEPIQTSKMELFVKIVKVGLSDRMTLRFLNALELFST